MLTRPTRLALAALLGSGLAAQDTESGVRLVVIVGFGGDGS